MGSISSCEGDGEAGVWRDRVEGSTNDEAGIINLEEREREGEGYF